LTRFRIVQVAEHGAPDTCLRRWRDGRIFSSFYPNPKPGKAGFIHGSIWHLLL